MIAGLPQDAFERITKESANKLAPGGKLIMKPLPNRNSYPTNHHSIYLEEANDHVLRLQETDSLQTLLVYADYGDASTASFVEQFFPFSVALAISVPDTLSAKNGNERNRLLNELADAVIKATIRLREVARAVSEQTDIANLTPLLLPVRNFRSEDFEIMLKSIFRNVSIAEDPKSYLQQQIKMFYNKHPRKYAPDADRHCLSDGIHYFQSPGKALHGFRRHAAKEGHSHSCLLNARCRLGGNYRHSFHYDCLPVKGKLRAHYDNCHGSATPPKDTHVNIAPNDFVI